MRLEALLVIHQTADELSAPESIAPPAAGAHAANLAPPTDAPPTRVRGKIRRWGTSSGRPRGVRAGSSALGDCAPFFFYPLMARYDDPGHTFRLLTEDCFLLEQVRAILAFRNPPYLYICRP